MADAVTSSVLALLMFLALFLQQYQIVQLNSHSPKWEFELTQAIRPPGEFELTQELRQKELSRQIKHKIT